MKTLQEIKSTLNKNKQQLFAKYPIKSIAIFGSCARNEQMDKSDVDIMVEFKDKIGIRFFSGTSRTPKPSRAANLQQGLGAGCIAVGHGFRLPGDYQCA